MHPPFNRLGSLMARKNVGSRPRLLRTNGDRWVCLPTEPRHYTRSPRGFPVPEVPETGCAEPRRSAADALERRLDVRDRDAVLELVEVRLDLGVAAVRILRDRTRDAVLTVQTRREVRRRQGTGRRVVLEEVPELAGEALDGRRRSVHHPGASAPSGGGGRGQLRARPSIAPGGSTTVTV